MLTLALFVKEFFLKNQMEPLLGCGAIEELLAAACEGEQQVATGKRLQHILETNMDELRKELVLLLLECVNLAIASRFDQHELEHVVAYCLLGNDDELEFHGKNHCSKLSFDMVTRNNVPMQSPLWQAATRTQRALQLGERSKRLS